MRRLALLIALVLSACAGSSQTYVANKDVGVYFTAPKDWFEVSAKALDKSEFDAINSVAAQERYDLVRWQIAYAPQRIKANQVLATAPQEFPVAYLRVRGLTQGERSSISLNTLRDLVFPVTSQGAPVSVLDDQEVSQSQYSGVDMSYEITINGTVQALRQIALMAPDRSSIYLFVVRCSKTCFQKEGDEINRIADSLTVRGTRG